MNHLLYLEIKEKEKIAMSSKRQLLIIIYNMSTHTEPIIFREIKQKEKNRNEQQTTANYLYVYTHWTLI